MNNLFVKTTVLLTETIGEETQTTAQKINEFFTSDAMKATGYVLLAVAVVAHFVFKFLKGKRYIR